MDWSILVERFDTAYFSKYAPFWFIFERIISMVFVGHLAFWVVVNDC